jgi:hypothetical protein
MGDVSDVGKRTGLVLTVAAFAALAGPPISGAIIRTPSGLNSAGYYAGEMANFFFGLDSSLHSRQHDFGVCWPDAGRSVSHST